MRTSPQWQPAGYQNRRNSKRPLVILTVVGALLLAIGFVGYKVYQAVVVPALAFPGCSAGTGANAIQLDFGQAEDTATIAAVAARMKLPTRALTIAYATAYQESKWENLTSGDRDSVGIFQQRPSEGWGAAASLEDPAYATGKFFGALVKVPNYTSLPVDEAAQDVQHSAAGSAYEQWATTGAQLAADYTTAPHAVTCWYTPAAQASAQGVSGQLDLHGAAERLDSVFGTPGAGGAIAGITRASSGSADDIKAAPGAGWTVADWVVANASTYGITQVSYDGWQWTASLTETSWQPAARASASDIVAS